MTVSGVFLLTARYWFSGLFFVCCVHYSYLSQ